MPLQRDSRVQPREELLAQIQATRRSEVHIMSAQIGRGGMFLRGEPAEYPELKVGTSVEVVVFNVERPGDDDVTLDARVVRVEQGLAKKHGIGLKFGALSHYEAGALETLLERLGAARA